MSSVDAIDFWLLIITDGFDAQTVERVAAALGALPAGLAAVQLRARELGGRALLQAALALRAVTHTHGARLFVNDRLDVALASGADGVQLPSRGLPARAARRACGDRLLLGASTHSLDEARMQAQGGADLVTFGPVYATASKAGFGPPVGLAELQKVASALTVPVFALGGVDAERVVECVRAGARVACIGAVLGRPDPAEGARIVARGLAS